MAKSKGTCTFDGCENEIQHTELGICYTCYSGLRYWRDRPVMDKRRRIQQLERLQARMDYMLSGSNAMPKTSSNVIHFPKTEVPKKKKRKKRKG